MFRYQDLVDISVAKTLAQIKHAGQEYGKGEDYFLYHIEPIVNLISVVINGNITKTLIQVAYLHDIIEDSDVTLQDIKSLFSRDVTIGVDLCTDGEGATRKEALYRKYSENGPRNYFYIGATVKCADRIINLQKSIKTNSKHLVKYVDEDLPFVSNILRYADKRLVKIYNHYILKGYKIVND